MKIIRQIHLLLGAIFILAISHVDAQVTSDSSAEIIEYKSLEEALNNPHMVYKLNLSNQSSLVLSDDIWSKFPNLEYLSLKNVGLDEVPYGIGGIKTLTVLDLSGNNFTVLPESFSGLENLREIYLNDEEAMDANQSLVTIKDLPNLTILHLENDNLENLPPALSSFTKLKGLYLDSNRFSTLSDNIWNNFQNLEYLSLKDDHLNEIPSGIGNLSNLRVLDLSGNDFKVLPQSFSQLKNLREIYLNEETEMDVDQSLSAIKDLPNLRVLHLENDNLESIPRSLMNLTQLEAIYLNKNNFNSIPIELKELNNLNYIDLHDNAINLKIQERQIRDNFGIKIRI